MTCIDIGTLTVAARIVSHLIEVVGVVELHEVLGVPWIGTEITS